MKQKAYIIIINIVSVIIIFLLLELFCIAIEIFRMHLPLRLYNYSYFQKIPMYSSFQERYNNIVKNKKWIPIVGTQYKDKPSIVIFGCSFAYGLGIDENHNFSSKLSDYTKRTVYNRAYPGWGIQDMLYQVKTHEFYNEIDNPPEYVIYVYIPSHTDRLYAEVAGLGNANIFYKNTKSGLQESKFQNNIFYKTYIAQDIRRIKAAIIRNTKGTEKLAIEHFVEARREMQKHWANTKFYVLVYNYFDFDKIYLEKLENYGYKVIFTENITSEDINQPKYQISAQDKHPNEAVWDLLVPIVSQQLGIK